MDSSTWSRRPPGETVTVRGSRRDLPGQTSSGPAAPPVTSCTSTRKTARPAPIHSWDPRPREYRCSTVSPSSPGTSPRTTAEKATDGAGGSGYTDRSHPDSPSELPFQDACSVSPSPSSPGSSSASWVPRASAMRRLAAVAWPSMQWA